MSRQKEIEEFLEFDKDNVELVEGIAACHAEYGEAAGVLKGKSIGWREAADVAARLLNEGRIDSKTYSMFVRPFLRAMKAADRKRPHVYRETRTRERATWKVLKRRLRRAAL